MPKYLHISYIYYYIIYTMSIWNLPNKFDASAIFRLEVKFTLSQTRCATSRTASVAAWRPNRSRHLWNSAGPGLIFTKFFTTTVFKARPFNRCFVNLKNGLTFWYNCWKNIVGKHDCRLNDMKAYDFSDDRQLAVEKQRASTDLSAR